MLAPVIDPSLVYKCADVIAVRSVPGAALTVFSDGNPTYWQTAGDWSNVWPSAGPFSINQRFSAQISMCDGEKPSPLSAEVLAVTDPPVLPTPAFEPARAYDMQRLVSLRSLTNGAHTKLTVSGVMAGEVDTPISWTGPVNVSDPIGRPLRVGDTLSAAEQLCASAPPINLTVSKCSALPAPRIEPPIAGMSWVVVANAVPGARILIVDASGTIIGNGSGSRIGLSRALVAGDELTAIQQLQTCRSLVAQRLSVRQG